MGGLTPARTGTALLSRQALQADGVVLQRDISGNHGDGAIPDPVALRIDRERTRHRVAFGFRIHRCMRNRLGELRLRIDREAMMKRLGFVETAAEPGRRRSNCIRGIAGLPVRLHRRH
jgi:cytochrome P450